MYGKIFRNMLCLNTIKVSTHGSLFAAVRSEVIHRHIDLFAGFQSLECFCEKIVVEGVGVVKVVVVARRLLVLLRRQHLPTTGN